MKNIVILFLIAPLALSLKAQTGLHFQFHKHSVDGNAMFMYHKDSIISLCKIGTVSGSNNAIALLNPNSNAWTYLNSPITPSLSPTMLMKNRQQGVIYAVSGGAYTTSDGWQTSTALAAAQALLAMLAFGALILLFLRTDLSVALGSYGVSLLQMTSGFQVFQPLTQAPFEQDAR